ncbi:MAG: DNA polymerase II small subunit, partial [Thaumarchaeota archaeon]|nr:DNA polymerase II small subunit [Nitrososphaerota archaeon]
PVKDQLARLDDPVPQIPEPIRVVISPGNHDPGRRALPQPAIPRELAPGLWGRPNVEMVGNPATVLLNGVRVLMFHGQSVDDVVKVAPGLSYDRPAGVMKFLLRARHLCPIYGGGTPLAPESEDMLVVGEAPDIFHAGHVHVVGAEQYRGVLMVNSGTWQGQTPFQAGLGIEPTVGRAIVVNLKTLAPVQRDFA